MRKSKQLVPLIQAPSFRVTSLQNFEECPHRWWADYQGILPRRESPAAKIGTAMHKVMEDYLEGRITETGQALRPLISAGVTEDERENVIRYIGQFAERRMQTLATELEFELEMLPGAPKIQGHIDYVGLEEDGALHVVDHKSNRSWDGVSYWAAKLQTVLYSWAVMNLWPEHAHRLKFSVGYINLGGFVTWEVSPEIVKHATERFEAIWSSMNHYDAAQRFEQRFNSACGWCALKDRCEEYQRHVTDFRASVSDLLSQRELPDRYTLLKTVIKVAQEALKDVESQLRRNVEESGGLWFAGEVIVKLEQAERRGAEFADVWPIVERAAAAYPETKAVIDGMLGDLFSVKVTGLDALVKKVPPLKKVLEPVIVKKPTQEKSIVITPVQAAITKNQ